MKNSLLAICCLFFLTSCAGVHVKHTYVATGAVHPKAIYIRPFDVTYTEFKGNHGSSGARVIRRSLAPAEFADDLKEELETLAPAMVIRDGEVPKEGWIVEGDLDIVHAGSPVLRGTLGFTGLGRSTVQIHVRVIDAAARIGKSTVGKNEAKSDEVVTTKREDGILYAFTVSGGSGMSGKLGSIYAPGLGYAVPFDFRNAAERIKLTLSTDPFRYGVRSSPTAGY